MTDGGASFPSPPAVIDEAGRVIRLTEVLSKGREGEVFLTEDPDLLVKLTAGSGAAARRRLERARRLPLDDLPVVRPEALLRDANFEGDAARRLAEVTTLGPPTAGYVMRYRRDLQPLAYLITRAPDHAWWRGTGGTEGRLRELGRLAVAIGALHRRGIVVGDISPRNLLGGASDRERRHPVAIIDPDGLRHASDEPDEVLCSPPHVAPEVVTGVAATTQASDVFAFAMIVAHVLTLVHPFFGDDVSDGPVEGEEEALAGTLPWILDEDDDSNRANDALDPAEVMTARLLGLLQRCFGPGRLRLGARPSAAGLGGALLDAADRCALCPACDGTGLGPRCLLCETRIPTACELTLSSESGDDDVSPRQPDHVLTLWEGRQRPLERRVLGVRGHAADDAAMWVSGDGALARLRMAEDYELQTVDGVVPGGGSHALSPDEPVRLRTRDGSVVLRVRQASA